MNYTIIYIYIYRFFIYIEFYNFCLFLSRFISIYTSCTYDISRISYELFTIFSGFTSKLYQYSQKKIFKNSKSIYANKSVRRSISSQNVSSNFNSEKIITRVTMYRCL